MASSAARRYTQALVEIAQEKNAFDPWQGDLETLAALVADPEVLTFLESPAVQTDQKTQAVQTVASDVQPEALNLLQMLIERRRLRLLPDIKQLFDEAVLAAKGVVLVDVTTADALDDAGQELVRERLKSIVGKDVELRLHQDPSLIGGIVARIGDEVIDGSVVNQLRRLRARLNVDYVQNDRGAREQQSPAATLTAERDLADLQVPEGEDETSDEGLLGKVRQKVSDAGNTVLEKVHIKASDSSDSANGTEQGHE